MLRFGVHLLGFRVQVLGARAQVPGFRVQVQGARVQVPGFRVQVLGSGVLQPGFGGRRNLARRILHPPPCSPCVSPGESMKKNRVRLGNITT